MPTQPVYLPLEPRPDSAESNGIRVFREPHPLGSWLREVSPNDPPGYLAAVKRADAKIARKRLKDFLKGVLAGEIPVVMKTCPHNVPLQKAEAKSGKSPLCFLCQLSPKASDEDVRFANNNMLCVLDLGVARATAPMRESDIEHLQEHLASQGRSFAQDGVDAVVQAVAPDSEAAEDKSGSNEFADAAKSKLAILFSKAPLREIAASLGLSHPEQVKRLRSKVNDLVRAEVADARAALGFSESDWQEFQLEKLLKTEQAEALRETL